MRFITRELIDTILLENNKGFPQPVLQPIKGKKDFWIYVEDYNYDGHFIPKGFPTDLDSIPRIPFIYAILKGEARASAGIHDWHYATGILPRAEIDLIFYEHMLLEGVHPKKAKAIYLAVKYFGKKHYDKKRGVKRTFLMEDSNVTSTQEVSL